MKKIILVTMFVLGNTQGAFAQNCPNFSGTYNLKDCSVLTTGKWTPNALFNRLKYGKTIQLTQNGCDSIVVGGESEYNNVDATIYMKNVDLSGFGQELNLENIQFTDRMISVQYILKELGDSGIQNVKTEYLISLNRQDNGSIKISEKTRTKSLFTVGFWSKDTEAQCVISESTVK